MFSYDFFIAEVALFRTSEVKNFYRTSVEK